MKLWTFKNNKPTPPRIRIGWDWGSDYGPGYPDWSKPLIQTVQPKPEYL